MARNVIVFCRFAVSNSERIFTVG